MDTTNPLHRSFVFVSEDSHFPIQNLPYGVFIRKNRDEMPRIGTAIGDFVLDLSVLESRGLFKNTPIEDSIVFSSSSLNEFMRLGRDVWTSVRERIFNLLLDRPGPLRDNSQLQKEALIPIEDVILLPPVDIPNFTDFYASEYHATNVGRMFRGEENALLPNWKHLPVAYHGRASSVVVSGVDIHRPWGQVSTPDGPKFMKSEKLDFEFEMGFFVGPENKLGEPIPIERARDHIFGLVIVNDWSARDIQAWEYRPLGPFLAKNFATSISPWVVTLDALEPFLIDAPPQSPTPSTYLQKEERKTFDIVLETWLRSSRMDEPDCIMSSNFKHLYWTIDQMLAHHSITGCNMRTGDLLGTGTISGPTEDSRACLLEITWNGQHPLSLSSGETRTFLQDGDEVIMTAYCQGEGYRIGFGEVYSSIMPAHVLTQS